MKIILEVIQAYAFVSMVLLPALVATRALDVTEPVK